MDLDEHKTAPGATAEDGEHAAARILKNALFDLEKMKAGPSSYGGVLTDNGQYAWIEYSHRPQGSRPDRDGEELLNAARALLTLAESSEAQTLEGDEGCIWPVERFRVAVRELEAASSGKQVEAVAWRDMKDCPSDDTMVLAKNERGMMVWRAAILMHQPTPAHLDFKPVAWVACDDLDAFLARLGASTISATQKPET